MVLAAVAFAAFLATLAGGLFALRLRDRLHLILGFSAGAVVAVAFFDLLPEAVEIGQAYQSVGTLLAKAALGFLAYLVVDRIAMRRNHGGHHDQSGHHNHEAMTGRAAPRGLLGAASLSAHSFLDGLAIGFAFEASAAVGLAVAVAVLTHDFSDGINTAGIILKNGGNRLQALRWLMLDALTPALGIAATTLFVVPRDVFGGLLALFAGFFLYIGASDLIPESFHAHPKVLTTIMTLLGAAVLYLAVKFAGL